MERIYCDTLEYAKRPGEVLSRELRGEHNLTWAAYIECVAFGICCQVSHGGGLSPPRSLRETLKRVPALPSGTYRQSVGILVYEG